MSQIVTNERRVRQRERRLAALEQCRRKEFSDSIDEVIAMVNTPVKLEDELMPETASNIGEIDAEIPDMEIAVEYNSKEMILGLIESGLSIVLLIFMILFIFAGNWLCAILSPLGAAYGFSCAIEFFQKV